MPANTGADKFAGALRVREGGQTGRGIASGRGGGSNPFRIREESRRSETIYFLFLSAILLPHSNARGRGIEKGEQSQANWIRMLQDRKKSIKVLRRSRLPRKFPVGLPRRGKRPFRRASLPL